MRSKIFAASGSLVMGLALLFLALKSDPTASADTLSLDPMALVRFKIVLAAACILIIISFILFAMAAFQSKAKSD